MPDIAPIAEITFKQRPDWTMDEVKKEGSRRSNVMGLRNSVHDDPFRVVGCPDSAAALLLRQTRDRITCNEREKRILCATGFLDKGLGDCLEETCLVLEILAILASAHDEEIRDGVRKSIEQVFGFVRLLETPFSSIHVSIFRSFRVILSRTGCDMLYERYFADLMLVLESGEQSQCLNAVRNEIIGLLCVAVDADRRVRDALCSRKTIETLSSPSLNAMMLLDRLIDGETAGSIRIDNLFERTRGASTRSMLQTLSCCVKLYKLGSACEDTMRKIVGALDSLVFRHREALLLIGRMAEDDVQVQLLCRDSGLVSRISDQFQGDPEQLTPELLFCLYSLTGRLEENRKAVARSRVVPAVFRLLRLRTGSREMDPAFVIAILLLKSMTRSVTFLRSGLLDYPVVELLMAVLRKDNPDTVCGMEAFVAAGRGLVNEGILDVLMNLVMEYGDYKAKFIACGGVEKVLGYRQQFPLAVLHIFKNFLYDTSFSSKEVFIRSTDKNFFREFFEMYEQAGDLGLLEGCFNLMRNLLCDDTIDYIVQNYEDLTGPIFRYLGVFACMESIQDDSREEAALLQILYTIVNLSANSQRFKTLVLDAGHLGCMKKTSTTRNLRIAFIWIIINLSWREDGHEARVQILHANGIREWLVGIQARDPVLADKVGTALENLR